MTASARATRIRPDGFYLRLTELGRSGNQVLRSVCPMTQQLTPTSGREDSVVPRLRPGSPGASGRHSASGRHGALASELGSELGVRPGESDPARMLGGVLLLVVATIVMVLALAWWLI